MRISCRKYRKERIVWMQRDVYVWVYRVTYSDLVLNDISVRSPRTLIIIIMKNSIYRIIDPIIFLVWF